MANSSPPSRPQRLASPPARPQSIQFAELSGASDFLSELRNSPEAHRRNFEDAQREHQRVLAAALHVYELHQLAEATRQIEQEELRRRVLVAEEEKKIQKEREAKIKQLEDEVRLAAQKAAPIPKPPIIAPPPSAAAVSSVAGQPKSQQLPQLQKLVSPTSVPLPSPSASLETASPANKQSPAFVTAPSRQANIVSPAPTAQPAVQSVVQPAVQPAVVHTKPAEPTPPQPAPSQTHSVDRHIEVHRNLKNLRKFVVEQAKTNTLLKQRMGDMRRDIRKSLGQLTSGGLRENKIPVARLVTVLHAGLNEVPSELLDPNQFLLEPITQPVEGATHNEPQLPSLYLYLLNIMAKAAISQFINESGADTRTAEAIGQAVVKVYSESEFLWRGKPMIDMLISKYRIVCPVLFGFHGSDHTEQGRARIGWKKENGRWITEQYHMDRMTGLGAGFAALTLRDFSRVKRPNPWPPSVYWTSLAKIINTPPAEMSDTQCYVLKAMIANNEARFMTFYGNAAVAALHCALVDYPARAIKPTSGTETLKVLAKSLAMKTGLDLGHM